MQIKKCSVCGLELSIENFSSKLKSKDGLQGFCKECHSKYRRKHYLENRQKYIDKANKQRAKKLEWFKNLKGTFKCNRCGENHPACLHFHHKDSSIKDGCISRFADSASKKRLLVEIEKCEVLCANCHSKEHFSKSYADVVK